MYQSKGVYHLDRIIIYNYDKTEKIVMPKTKDVSVGADEVSKKTTMASSKIVKDIIGFRANVSASWDYVPAVDITRLIHFIMSGSFLWVEYPAPTGCKSGYFDIEYPSCDIFCYKKGRAVWHNVSIKMTAQEVMN